MPHRGSGCLLVAATHLEVALLTESFGLDCIAPEIGHPVNLHGTRFDLVVTGPGSVTTAFALAEPLASSKYSSAVNIGVAGSFSPQFSPGTVLRVTRDRFADLGAEAPQQGFIPGENLPFTLLNKPPYQIGWLEPLSPPDLTLPDILSCSAITSDTIHTNPESILRLSSLFNPVLESMEGAAFFYVCMKLGIPCLQFRAVSNLLGPRTPENWHVNLAVSNLNQMISKLIQSSSHDH